MQGPRLGVHPAGDAGDREAVDPSGRPGVRLEHQAHRLLVPRGGHDLRQILFERLAFDEQCLVVHEHGERVAGDDVLPLFNEQLLDEQGGVRASVGGQGGGAGSPHDDAAEQAARGDDVVDLRLREPMQQDRLPLGLEDGLELLHLVLAFEDGLGGDEPLGADAFEAGDLAPDDIDFRRGLEEVGLQLDELLVGQSQFEEWLIGCDRRALRDLDLREVAGERRDDREPRSPLALDDHAGHGDRPMERAQRHLALGEPDGPPGLLAQRE